MASSRSVSKLSPTKDAEPMSTDLSESSPMLSPPVLQSQLSSSSQSELRGVMDVRVVRQADVDADRAKYEQLSSVKIERYAMAEERGIKHGLMLIVEFEDFDLAMPKREGSHADVANLRNLFRQLRFDVQVMKNLSHAELKSELHKFANNKRHAQGYMMILAILSHGEDGIIYTSDGKTKTSTEDILKQFNNKNCELLKGKPKFFIFQACRGKEKDYGHRDSPARSSPRLAGATKRRRQSGDSNPSELSEDPVIKARPTWEDMIIAYSTIPGYISIRDHDQGTWFVQSLVQTFQDHAWHMELGELLRLTAETLSEFTSDLQEKQTCNVEMRNLYKKIYFSP